MPLFVFNGGDVNAEKPNKTVKAKESAKTEKPVDKNTVTVTISGAGIDKEKALEDAFRRAVEGVAGDSELDRQAKIG